MPQGGRDLLAFQKGRSGSVATTPRPEMTLIDDLKNLLGAENVLQGADALARVQTIYLPIGAPFAVLRPGSTEDLSRAMRLCHAAGRPVTPIGGLTNLVGSAHAEDAIVITLERMTAIEALDPVNATVTVQAGCKLQTVQEAAERETLFFPVDIGARGSATVGGVVSTNAGGNRVLRWGMARDNVLGLEAVLADGRVISSLNTLIKNNAGYDLKHLFIGSEGTLGIVTRAVLRLRDRPASQCTAFVSAERFSALPELLRLAHAQLGGALCAFEVMWGDTYALATTPPAPGRPPLPHGAPFYALIESMGSDLEADATRFEALLEQAFARSLITDGALAKSAAETAAMWMVREEGTAQTAKRGQIFLFDVSLKIGDMEAYVAGVRRALIDRFGPSTAVWVFGHLGDGNLHINLNIFDQGPDIRHAVEEIVYGPLARLGGSISAEHGVGLHKRDFLDHSRSVEEIALMTTLKAALDPAGLLNPGKVLPTIDRLIGSC